MHVFCQTMRDDQTTQLFERFCGEGNWFCHDPVPASLRPLLERSCVATLASPRGTTDIALWLTSGV